MLERFEEWTHKIEPEWAGFTVYASGIILVATTVFISVVLSTFATNGWFLLAIPAFILYAWYIALFKQ